MRDESKFAELLNARMTVVSGHLEAEGTSLSKWLLASALSINGGALVTTFSNFERIGIWSGVSAIAFCVGMFCALLFGIMQGKVISQTKIAVDKVIDNAEDVIVGKTWKYSGGNEAEYIRKAARLAGIAEWVLYTSIGSFLIGVVSVGVGLYD